MIFFMRGQFFHQNYDGVPAFCFGRFSFGGKHGIILLQTIRGKEGFYEGLFHLRAGAGHYRGGVRRLRRGLQFFGAAGKIAAFFRNLPGALMPPALFYGNTTV